MLIFLVVTEKNNCDEKRKKKSEKSVGSFSYNEKNNCEEKEKEVKDRVDTFRYNKK